LLKEIRLKNVYLIEKKEREEKLKSFMRKFD